MAAGWNVENMQTNQSVRMCYGDLCTEIPYTQATKLARRILGFTGADGQTSSSRTAAPAKKGGKKGGKC